MAYTTINKSTDYFNTKIYNSTGNDNLAITGVGFEADLTWIKKARVVSGSNTNEAHMWADQVRGSGYYISSSSNAGQTSTTNDLKSWQSDGFTLGTVNRVNQGSSAHIYASYNWKAGTTASGATTGSGTAKTYSSSSNSTAGFSILKYTGNGTAGHTVPHGCGSAPTMVIFKQLNENRGWGVYHKDLGVDKIIYLDENIAPQTASPNTQFLNNTAPSSSVVSLGTWSEVNKNDASYVAYCFAPKSGYSKFGSYTGNGNSDGTFVYTGFKPAWIMRKRYDGGTNHWSIMNNKRFGYNTVLPYLVANTEAPEEIDQNVNNIDILSNGFKCRESDANGNGSGNTYIYMAFAEAPLVGTNNVPCTAR